MPRVAGIHVISWNFLLNFCIINRNMGTGVFEVSYHDYHNVVDTRRTCCPGWHRVLSHLLEYSSEFSNNRSKFSTLRFSRSLDTNITMTMNPETPGAQGGGYACRLLEFRFELLKKLSKLTGQGFLRSLYINITTAMIPEALGA